MQREKKIVVLGAGYAGITLASRLDKRLANEIILIDSNQYHELIQQAHLVAAGIKKVEDTRIGIKKILKDTNIQFINSFVKKVNADKKMVVLDDGGISYDLLVVALGAQTQSFGIENVTKYCYTLRSIDDAIKIKRRIQDMIKNSYKDGRDNIESREEKYYKNQNNNNSPQRVKGDANTMKENVDTNYNDKNKIIIVGGGPTGVGICGTIAELIQNSGQNKQIEIILVTASATILSGMNESIVEEATKILKRKGVIIITQNIVSDVAENGIIFKDGHKISSSITIWTPGVRGFELPIEPEVEKTKDGRIVVNEFCQVDNHHEIFCIGDVGAIKDSSGKITDPTLGQIAISQAIHLARIFPEYLAGKQLEKFDFHPNVTILPMGSDDYIGTIDGNLIKGDMAKILKDFRYEAYKKEIISNEEILNDYLYKDDPLTNILLGFSLTPAILGTSINLSKNKEEIGLPDSAKEFLNKSKDVSSSTTKWQ